MLDISVIFPHSTPRGPLGLRLRALPWRAPAEIIVVDDGSLDCTAEVARSLPGVIVLTIPNGGPATARNAGISAAGSEWIALLDADDWWLPGKLARQLEEAEPDVGLITTLSDRTPADVCPECVTVADLLRANPLRDQQRSAAAQGLGEPWRIY